MNQGYGTSAYFATETDARRAAEDLRAQGCEVDVRSESSHGQSFWDSIKSFFSGEHNTDQYRTGAVLTVTGGNPQTVRTVLQQYNGRVNDATGTSSAAGTPSTVNADITGKSTVAGASGGLGMTGTGLGTTGTGLGAGGTGGVPPSTTGEIDDTQYIGGATDDLQSTRTTRDIDDRNTL